MKVTILGCGGPEGTPMIGCSCSVCRSKNPKNKRTRQSIYIESKETKLLVDVSPDFRSQALRANIDQVDGILITHPHADHICGLQDLRALCIKSGKGIDLFATQCCLAELKIRYNYLFDMCPIGKNKSVKILKGHALEVGQKCRIGDIEFIPFMQKHGDIESTGFLFDGFAYSTDFKYLDETAINLLKGVNLWMLDCIGDKRDYYAHVNLKEARAYIDKVNPKHAILVHMSHEMDCDKDKSKLPANVKFGFDGMKVDVSF